MDETGIRLAGAKFSLYDDGSSYGLLIVIRSTVNEGIYSYNFRQKS